MKFVIQTILIALLSYFTQSLFVWWTCAISAFFITAIIPTRPLNAFLAGLLGIGLLWLIFIVEISYSTENLLTEKVLILFWLDDKAVLVIATLFIGAILGGMGALSGSLFRELFEGDQQEGYYKR